MHRRHRAPLAFSSASARTVDVSLLDVRQMKRAVVSLNERGLPIDPLQIFHNKGEGILDALELSILLANNWPTKFADPQGRPKNGCSFAHGESPNLNAGIFGGAVRGINGQTGLSRRNPQICWLRKPTFVGQQSGIRPASGRCTKRQRKDSHPEQ